MVKMIKAGASGDCAWASSLTLRSTREIDIFGVVAGSCKLKHDKALKVEKKVTSTCKIRQSSEGIQNLLWSIIQNANMYKTYRTLSNIPQTCAATMKVSNASSYVAFASQHLESRKSNSTEKKFRVKTSKGNVTSSGKSFQRGNVLPASKLNNQKLAWTPVFSKIQQAHPRKKK